MIPVLYESLQQALRDTFGEELPLPRLLRFGTWVGGDMDGNPNVDATTIRNTLDAQRRAVLGRYQKELLQLASLLSQSTERVGVSDALQARVAQYQQLLPQVQSRPRHADMPYRLLNDRMRARLQATLDDGSGAYAGPAELIDDLQLILDSLRANRGEHAGGFAVQRLLWRVKTFGFHLARLDVRQESSVHARALAAVLGGDAAWEGLDALGRARLLAPHASGEAPLPKGDDEGNRRTDAVFAALADARARHGGDALGSYIISMAHDRSDVLAVLALARRGGLVDADDTVPLDIAPLFETVDDLKRGTATLRDLLDDPVYRTHLRARGDVQMVMLGYSDSSKDGGIAASRWGLQRAQVELLEVAAEAGIRLTFFHGRGGSISRGGGKTTHAVDASPRGSIDGRLRVTEQGEVIHRKYGIRALALRSLEQAAGAVLRASLRPRAAEPREDAWRPVMDAVSSASSEVYRAFVGQACFMDYFRTATPIDVIERMTLGSRPSRRLGQDAALGNLRAIPWVFARSGRVPSFPAGTAWAAACRRRWTLAMKRPCAKWRVTGRSSAPSDDIAMVLSKGDITIAEQFSLLSGDLHGRFFPQVQRELELTRHWLLALMDQKTLLDHDARLALSIRLRNPYVDPISVLQVDLLQRWRASGREDDELLRALVACVNGVSQGCRTRVDAYPPGMARRYLGGCGACPALLLRRRRIRCQQFGGAVPFPGAAGGGSALRPGGASRPR